MLAVSGAEQLNTSGAQGERPMISQSGAYSRLLNPAPRSLSGRNRFHRPASRAAAFISRIGGVRQRSPRSPICASKTASHGSTTWFMKPLKRPRRVSTLSL